MFNMTNVKKRRSSLKDPSEEMKYLDIKQLRRISFCGKKSVRIFSEEEEPKTWDDSYEISDHLNVNETAKNACSPSAKNLRNALKFSQEHKENFDNFDTTGICHLKQKRKSHAKNTSVLSTTDLINASYQNQNSKMYQIENSVDITLFESEKKLQVGKVSNSDETNLYSFSFKDIEAEKRTLAIAEKTIEFTRDLRNDVSTGKVNNTMFDSKNENSGNFFNEYVNKDPIHDCTYNKSRNLKEAVTLYMNDSLSISSNERISIANINPDKRKTINKSTTMHVSNQYDEANLDKMSNKTQNNSCQMEIEEENISHSPSNEQIKISPQIANKTDAIQNVRSQEIEFYPNVALKKSKKIGYAGNINSHLNQNFNQTIEVDTPTIDVSENKLYHVAIPKAKSRPTITFNQSLEKSPLQFENNCRRKTVNLNEDMNLSSVKLLHESASFKNLNLQNFNQTIKDDTLTVAVSESNTHQGTISKTTPRPTINFNQSLERSSLKYENNLRRKTMNSNEDMNLSPVKLLHESASCKNLNPQNINQTIEDDTSTVAVSECGTIHDALPKAKSYPTITFNQSLKPVNLNEDMNWSPIKILHESNSCKNLNLQNFNQTIEVDKPTVSVSECKMHHSAIPKTKSQPTITFNQSIERSPLKFENNLWKTTVNINEDMNLSSLNVLQESISCKNLNFSASKPKNSSDMEYPFDVAGDKMDEAQSTEKPLNTNKSLSFIFDTGSNMSLSPESSPLIPLEFRGHILKQLESPKERRKTLFFEDVDIAISDETLQSNTRNAESNNVLSLNNALDDDPTNKIDKGKYRYSQADDIMLDNTIFLTRAKLSDESVSRNSSKRNASQTNDMDIFQESPDETECKLERSILKANTTWDQENNLGPALQNIKPIFTQIATNIEDKVNIPNGIKKELHSFSNDNIYKDFDVVKVSGEVENQKILTYNQQMTSEESIENALQLRNVQEKQANHDTCNSISARKTYFHNEIPLEKNSISINQENVQIEKFDEYNLNTTERTFININNNSHLKMKTLIAESFLSNEKTPLKKLTNENEENDEVLNSHINSYNSNPTRKTMYFNREISVEGAAMEIKSNVEYKKFDTDIIQENIVKTFDNLRVNPPRKTLYFNNEISGLEVIDRNVYQSPRSVDTPKYNDLMMLNDTMPENVCKPDFIKNKAQFINLASNNIHGTELSSDKVQVSKGRKSIYTPEFMDLTLEDNEESKNQIENEKQELVTNINPTNACHTMNLDLNITPLNNAVEYEKDKKNIEESKPFCFSKNKTFKDKEILFDQTFVSAKNFQFLETSGCSNDAEKAFPSHTIISSLRNKSKLFNKQESVNFTPMKFSGSNKNNSLLYMTPRLSLLEFKALEFKAGEEEREEAKKRLTDNLTPLFSMAKKRQTLLFDESNLNDEMEMSVIVQNEFVLQTPQKERKSRIPVPISCDAGNINRSFSLIDTGKSNNKEDDVQLDVEGDNFSESIQLMRRATIVQREDRPSKQIELDVKYTPNVKPSIYEVNPITISDVSEFFEVQRKSTAGITLTEISIPLDKPDSCIVKRIEDSRKCLENRAKNLTLENIDETRLSLVELSYEDGTANVPSLLEEDIGIKEQSPSNNQFKNEVKKINYLRNDSVICRKCRRCQETFYSETSGESDDFVLPKLPPLPDLGLSRLRRLRKRPTIADVHILCQHSNLDYTIINVEVSDPIDQADEKDGPVPKFIRKYEKDMMSFKMDLIEKQHIRSEKLPFVLKLDNLLRTNSTNWIFDYQMQHRGILLFTHRKMLTFRLSLTFEEADPLGHDIRLKNLELEKSHVSKKNWKPIDFVLEFQLKLNLPYNIQMLCKDNNEADIFNMLQDINQVCLDTLKMGNSLHLICITNHASILRDGGRNFVRKIIRKIVSSSSGTFKYVNKFEIKVELFNLKELSFKDIVSPPLHYFREEIHLLPTGLKFLQEFLPNPLNYLKHN